METVRKGSKFTKASAIDSDEDQGFDENIHLIHRHCSSSGKVPKNLSNFNSLANSPPISAENLNEMKKKMSKFEHRELSKYPEVYYLGLGRPVVENYWDDREGYYKIFKDDHINYRYQIVEELGRGSYGSVIKCKDMKTEEMVAVKILRKKAKILQLGQIEVDVLNTLQSDIETYIVSKIESFVFREHLCIVFELLSTNLYDFIKNNQFQGLRSSFIKRVTTQVLTALKHTHSCRIIHCDIKPENVVLKHENKSCVKLVDFGSASRTGSQEFYIQSRFYRAPEVILEKKWDEKIDIWSLGCMVAEMATGWPLFTGTNELDVLFHIIFLIGLPEKTFFSSGRKFAKLNYDDIKEDYDKSLDKNHQSIRNALQSSDNLLIDFVESCLKWNPSERMTADEGLSHPWIRGN